MASEPSRLLGQRVDNMEEDSDIDAEGEEDMDDGHIGMDTNGVDHNTEVEGSDVDAEGEEVEDEQDDVATVSAVKIPGEDAASEDEDEDAIVESSSDAKSSSESDEDTDGTSSESDAENEWEGESDSAEEVEAEAADPNRCVFCGQDEEHDPSEEFEEYLACAVCGDNAHRQCARNADSLAGEDEAVRWRCNNCIDNGLEEETKHASDSALRRRSSAPKIARDLLPSSRGAIKPDSHSVFNTLILDDDPMDGSRSLRKRKASDEAEHVPRPSRKRRRPSDAASQSGADFEAPITFSPVVARNDASEDLGLDGASDGAGSPNTRSTRPRRARKIDKPLVRIVSSDIDSLIVSFNIDSARVTDILSKKRRRQTSGRHRDRSRKIQAVLPPEPEPSHYPAIQSNFSTAFYAFHDREQDESKLKPYGGILSEADADTTKTFPQNLERKRFEDARLKAEEDWKLKMAAAGAAQEVTRPAKISGPPSKIKCINFGGYEIDTWHAAPYPEEYSRNRVLYICEFCLKYMSSDYVAWRHKLKCPAKHPPGDEIYRDGKYSFFEVDGRKNPVYCQNLCLLAKLFLGSKTLYYDVEPFLFYVMTENDEFGCHFVGYFSKEKRPSSLNNVSCILVLPIHQRKGFGHMLIEFSYLLTRVEQKTGSPEKPLSDMGLVSYRGYWRLVLCHQLLHQRGPISISTLSERTGMTPDDIISALEGLRALVKDPVTKTYALRLDYAYYKQYVANYESKKYPKINADALVWVPYVMGRGALAHYDDAPAIHTIAQREDGMDAADTPEEGVQMALQNDAAAGGDSQDADDALLTPRDEVQRQLGGMSLDSPSRTSQPSTPYANGQPAGGGIPPTRFEVFPPIPGIAAARRRNNRPFGSRRRTGTPVRRSLANGSAEVGGARSVRRGRSMLAEAAVVVDGDGDGGEEEGKEGEAGEVREGNQVNGVVGDSEMRDVRKEAGGEGEGDGDDA